MDINTIYQEIDKVILKNLMLNDDAMKLCQSMGFNGFKRMHKYNIKFLLCEHIKLENNMFDKYRKTLETDVTSYKYKANTIKEHLYQWKLSIESDVKRLGDLNKEHFAQIGIDNNIIKCVLELLMHDYEKSCRWYSRFEEIQWNMHDIHYIDDKLHEKIKKIEDGE